MCLVYKQDGRQMSITVILTNGIVPTPSIGQHQAVTNCPSAVAKCQLGHPQSSVGPKSSRCEDKQSCIIIFLPTSECERPAKISPNFFSSCFLCNIFCCKKSRLYSHFWSHHAYFADNIFLTFSTVRTSHDLWQPGLHMKMVICQVKCLIQNCVHPLEYTSNLIFKI